MSVQCSVCSRVFSPWPKADVAKCPNCGNFWRLEGSEPRPFVDEIALKRASKARQK